MEVKNISSAWNYMWFVDKSGTRHNQSISYPKGGSKGLKTILIERVLWSNQSVDEARELLGKQSDFQ